MYGLRYGESREYSGGAELWILLYFPLATLSKWTSRQGTIITINRPPHRAQFGQISCKLAATIGIFLPKICIKTKRLKTIPATFFVHLLSKLKSQASLASGRLKSQVEEGISKWMMVKGWSEGIIVHRSGKKNEAKMEGMGLDQYQGQYIY